MGVHFTEDQQRAIDTLDKSILVSAAAGSGKTAVLVERIIHIILEGKANVDEMLVVTFTNAAAAGHPAAHEGRAGERSGDEPAVESDVPFLHHHLPQLCAAGDSGVFL